MQLIGVAWCQARCQKELSLQIKEQQSLVQQSEGLQQSVGSSSDRLQQFQTVMNWNEEELQRWATVALEKEDDRLALAQYQRQDEAKVKELNAKLDRYVAFVIKPIWQPPSGGL